MCRILGWAGDITSVSQHKKIEYILKGLILAEEKGNPHGTGLATFSKSGGHQLIKKGMRGAAFLLRGHADFLRHQKNIKAVLGHVRYRTAGEQNDKNAHPFGFRIRGDWYFGMHNGIIGCADELAKKFKVKGHPVDSATFFFCLAKVAEKNGLEEAIEEVTYEASLTGDFAFAIMRKGEIYLWRNDARPLAFFDLREEGLGRFFCSTKEMFEKALKLSGISFKKTVGYFEAKPYRLYKIGHQTSPELEVDVVKDLKYKEKPKPKTVWSGDYSNMSWLDAYDKEWQSRTSSTHRAKCSPASCNTPSLFDKERREHSKEEPAKDKPDNAWDDVDALCFISSLSNEELEMEIVETEAEVYSNSPKDQKLLKPYLNALYAEWHLRLELEEEHHGENKENNKR